MVNIKIDGNNIQAKSLIVLITKMDSEDIVKQIISYLNNLKDIHSLFLATKQLAYLKNYRFVVRITTAPVSQMKSHITRYTTKSISNKSNGMIYQFYNGKLIGFGYKINNRWNGTHVLHCGYNYSKRGINSSFISINTKKYIFDFTGIYDLDWAFDNDDTPTKNIFEIMMDDIYCQLVKIDTNIAYLCNMSNYFGNRLHIFFHAKPIRNKITFDIPKPITNKSMWYDAIHSSWLI